MQFWYPLWVGPHLLPVLEDQLPFDDKQDPTPGRVLGTKGTLSRMVHINVKSEILAENPPHCPAVFFCPQVLAMYVGIPYGLDRVFCPF